MGSWFLHLFFPFSQNQSVRTNKDLSVHRNALFFSSFFPFPFSFSFFFPFQNRIFLFILFFFFTTTYYYYFFFSPLFALAIISECIFTSSGIIRLSISISFSLSPCPCSGSAPVPPVCT